MLLTSARTARRSTPFPCAECPECKWSGGTHSGLPFLCLKAALVPLSAPPFLPSLSLLFPSPLPLLCSLLPSPFPHHHPSPLLHPPSMSWRKRQRRGCGGWGGGGVVRIMAVTWSSTQVVLLDYYSEAAFNEWFILALEAGTSCSVNWPRT